MEGGLGGRLDATNIIRNSLISVITNISLEHTQYLGNTIQKIANEKAGIIKNKGIVVTGTTGVALRVIEKIAKTRLPVIVSSGGSSVKDVDDIVSFFFNRNIPLAINHCVSLYPSEDNQENHQDL